MVLIFYLKNSYQTKGKKNLIIIARPILFRIINIVSLSESLLNTINPIINTDKSKTDFRSMYHWPKTKVMLNKTPKNRLAMINDHLPSPFEYHEIKATIGDKRVNPNQIMA